MIAELADDWKLTADDLAEAAGHFPVTTVRRLLDTRELRALTSGLERLVREHRRAPITALDRHGAPDGPVDHRWRVAVNTEIDPDL